MRHPWIALPAGLSLLATGIAGLGAVIGAAQPVCGTSALPGPAATNAIPSDLLPIYAQAAAAYDLGPMGWAYLAAINEVETEFGRDMSTSSAGAIGWMQFEPATWAQYGRAIGHSGPPDPYDPWDAIFAAAAYLYASGAPGDWSAAIYAYNHADWYVARVTATAQGYLGDPTITPVADTAAVSDTCQQTTQGSQPVYLVPGAEARILPDGQAAAPITAPAQVRAAIAAASEIIDRPYLYGGGHDQPLTTTAPSYDCSSAVSYLLHGGGLLSEEPETSTQLESYGDPGPGQWITVYANATHTFVAIAGIEFDTSPSGNPAGWQPPGSGPRWRPDPTGNLHDGLAYVVRHPPGL